MTSTEIINLLQKDPLINQREGKIDWTGDPVNTGELDPIYFSGKYIDGSSIEKCNT